MGHMAKDCRVQVYNVGEASDDTTGEQQQQQQQQSYEEHYNHQAYDPPWSEQEAWHYEQQWYPEQHGQEYNQHPPTLQQAQTVCSVKVEELFVASITSTDLNTDATVAIMVDSGAAVHVCSPTFGTAFPLQPLKPADTPPLRSVTDEPLKILGYRWIRFYNKQGQQLVTQIYHGWSRGFNRGFQSLMVQGNPYNFDVTEHGTQRTLRVHVNWALILSTYSFENGFVWNQYIPMNIREYQDSPGTDPRHTGLSMVLYNDGVSFSRFLPAYRSH